MTSKIIPSFASGEISPSLHSRVDISKYSTGLKTCRNFNVNTQGGVSKRTGTRYIETAKYSDVNKKVRLIPFDVSKTDSYALEFGDYYIRFYKDKNIILQTINSFDVFNASIQYNETSKISIEYYGIADFGSNKKLFFYNDHDGSYPTHFGFGRKIYVTINSTDNLEVSYSFDFGCIIKLANTTKSKNSAKLIQDALNLNTETLILNLKVCETSEYAADRTGGSFTAIGILCNKIYECINSYSGNSNNTSIFPLTDNSQTIHPNWELSLLTDPLEIITPYSSEDIQNIKMTRSADVLFISHPDYPTYELSRYSDVYWTFLKYNFDIPPFMISNNDITKKLQISATYGNSVTLTANYNLFGSEFNRTELYKDACFKIYHDIDGQSIKQNFIATGTTGSISCFGTWRFHTFFNDVSTAESDLTITIEKSTDNGGTWKTYRTFILLNSYADTFGTEDEFCLLRMNCTAWVKGVTATLVTDPYSKAGIFKVNNIENEYSATGSVISQFASTSLSFDWSQSSWSKKTGYPQCVTFYQDRIVFANTKTEPSTLWFSKTGDYYSFDVNETIQDTDAISIFLTSRKLNGINNLISLSNLIALTSDNSFSIASSTGVLTPTTISASLQENVEANSIDTIIASNKIIYMSNNTILKDISYDYNSATYKGNDLNVLANHLFEGYTVLDLDYKKDKNSIIYMVRSDGKMVLCNYMPEQEVLAFSWYETDGLFESVAVLNTPTKKEVWVSVLRDNGRFIEIFEEEYTDVVNQFYLDSAIIYNDVATTTIDGLDHLEGQNVYVFGDGNVIKNLNDLSQTPLTVTNGEITLPYPVEYAIIGLPYIADFETLPIDIQIQSGTISDKKKRISSVIFIFQNSRGGYIGDREVGTVLDTSHTDTLNEVINERPNMDLPLPLFTGKYKHSINGSWGLDKTVFYRQYDPLPVNILGIIPNFEIGG